MEQREHVSSVDNLVSMAKALSDGSRVRALLALSQNELCACQLVSYLDLAPSTVSKHMSVLRQSGLVELRKEGRWVYFRRHEGPEARPTLDWVDQVLGPEFETSRDRNHLDRILAVPKEDLCR